MAVRAFKIESDEYSITGRIEHCFRCCFSLSCQCCSMLLSLFLQLFSVYLEPFSVTIAWSGFERFLHPDHFITEKMIIGAPRGEHGLALTVKVKRQWLYHVSNQQKVSVVSRMSLIVRVNVVLSVVVDSDWRFENLCGSHLQSQSELWHVSWWY